MPGYPIVHSLLWHASVGVDANHTTATESQTNSRWGSRSLETRDWMSEEPMLGNSSSVITQKSFNACVENPSEPCEKTWKHADFIKGWHTFSNVSTLSNNKSTHPCQDWRTFSYFYFFDLATLHGSGTEYPVGFPEVIVKRHIYSLGDQPWSQKYKLDPEQHVYLN